MSLERTAAAVRLLEDYARPQLPLSSEKVTFTGIQLSMRRGGPALPIDDAVARDLLRLTARVDRVANWTVPMAIGLSPIEYTKLHDVLPGVVQRQDGTFDYSWSSRQEPTVDAARRSLEVVAKLALRLWWSDLLHYPEV